MAFGIAVVGLDHWYTAHGVCETVAASAQLSLIGISDPDETHRAWASEKYPTVAVSTTPDTLLVREDVHLVAICAPTADAPELAQRALAAGKHVISVKPPARTLAELDSVIAVATQAGRFYGSFEGLQRLTPRVQKLRELIQGGAIGTPLSYHQIGHGGLPSPWPGQPSGAPSWWIDPTKAPMGAWADHAIYAIDLARYAFDGEIDWAAGLIENRVHTDLPLEDYGIALFRLRTSQGAHVSLMLEDTWAAEPGGGAHRVQFIGSKGSLRPDGNGWILTTGGQETKHDAEATPFFHFEALAEALTSGASLPWSAEDARANLTACLRIYSTKAPFVPRNED